ncbi:uncharacterized protein ACIBXB_005997 [Morphnus guianensis]
MGFTVSSSHVISAASSSSGARLITLFPCSSVGSLPWETVLHKLLQRGSFPRAAVLHELLQHGSLPQRAVLQEHTAPAWVPHGVTSPARKPAPAWAPLSTDPQFLPEACSSVGFPRGHSLLQEPTCSSVGSSLGCRWISAPLWTCMDCRGTACLTMVFTTGCRGISAPAPGAPPPPPSSLTLVSAGLFLLHVLTPLSGCCFCLSHNFFFFFFKCYHRGVTTIADWLGLGRRRVRLRAGWHWLCRTQGKLPAASYRSHPCNPPPPRYQNLATQNQYIPPLTSQKCWRDSLDAVPALLSSSQNTGVLSTPF